MPGGQHSTVEAHSHGWDLMLMTFLGARREKRYMFHDDLLTAKWLGFRQDILRESISEEEMAAKPLKD